MLLKRSLLTLCSAIVAMAASVPDAVASGALFIGDDTTDSSATAIQIFQNAENYATAAATVLVYSGVNTGFEPWSVPSKTLGSTVVEFLKRASSFPGFILVSSEQKPLALNGSLIQLEEAVREASHNHHVLVGRSVRDLVPGYIVDKTLTRWSLLLTAIEKPDGSDDVSITFTQVNLDISTDKHHNAVIPEQDATINTSVLQLNGVFLNQNAAQLANTLQITRLHDAIHFFTSPKDISGDDERFKSSHSKWPSVNEKQRILAW
ncbi:hypothetical protein BGZ73_003366 [Actinomortierella ambigua]|nr:hypothetical protein BGZ73_003366 [Actinomortierella ambigua]